MNKKDILFFNKKLKYTGSICRRIVKCLNIVQLEILRPLKVPSGSRAKP
jgi:hypothetical protein